MSDSGNYSKLADILPELHSKLRTGKPRPCRVPLSTPDPVPTAGGSGSEDSGTSNKLPTLPSSPAEEYRELTPDLHVRAPDVPKHYWKSVGDLVVAHEKTRSHVEKSENGSGDLPGSKWLTLRLDGHGFSKFVKVLRREGVLPEKGYSDVFGETMQHVCEAVMKNFNGKFAYTQSDEMTIVVPATELEKLVKKKKSSTTTGNGEEVEEEDDTKEPEHFPHHFNGRVQKMATLSASLATAVFNRCLQKHVELARARKAKTNTTAGGSDPAEGEDESTHDLDSLLATFDCRIGAFDSQDEAFALVLWRCYDCGVNGVSDKVYQLKSQLPKKDSEICKENPELLSMVLEFEGLINKPVQLKLEWLLKFSECGKLLPQVNHTALLPLPDHQAYGTFFQVVKHMAQGTNPKTGELAPARLKRKIVRSQRNLLLQFSKGELFLKDEEEDAPEAK